MALADYTSALELTEVDVSSVLTSRAICFMLMEDYSKSLSDFNNAMKEDPNNTAPYFGRAKLYRIQGELELEINDYKMTIEMNGEDPEGYYYLAICYEYNKSITKSVIYMGKAIDRMTAGLNYWITEPEGVGKVELSSLYIRLAGYYETIDEDEMMCESYKMACDLGDCESFLTKCGQ